MSNGPFGRSPGAGLDPMLHGERIDPWDFRVPEPIDIPTLVKAIALRKAANRIDGQYLRRGGPTDIGVLGNPIGKAREVGNGSYVRSYEFGTITVKNMDDVPVEEFYTADIDIAAIRCFGTEDPGGLFKPAADEPYLIITAVAPANAFVESRRGKVVSTWRSQTFSGIKAGAVFGTDIPVFRDILFGPRGIALKVLLMEHEHGSEEDLRRRIEEKGAALSREIVDAAGLLAGLDLDGQITDQVLDSNILDTLGDISVSALTALLQDDKIDEKTWWVPGSTLVNWADQRETYRRSHVIYPNGEIPPHIKTNFPYEGIFDRSLLFSGGGGSYKVYLRVTPRKVRIS